ncbi:MAG TPA: hypothetical protein VFR03_00980 [Thermoanaerobaculia bacterium]|nr:hypothetical protein [Thermoanaerobaculia bacterium]
MRTSRLPALALSLAFLGLAAAPPDPASLERALTSPDAAAARRAGNGLAALARERGRALALRGSWSHDDVLSLLALQLVDPERFAGDEAFRRRVLPLLPRMLDPRAPAGLRDALLLELNQVRGFDFAASDEVERAWGAIPRRAAERRAEAASGLRFDADTAGRLTASVYSLPSFFFDSRTADAFLSAVHAASPERTLVVLTDSAVLAGLAPRSKELNLRLLDTHGRPYSPWPRDPFSLVHTREGALRVLVCPNLQPGREEDANLGPELVRSLPEDLDRAWGKVTWATAPVPFHNGQVLLTPDAAWITLHALEPRVLALLKLDRVPVASFSTAAGIDRYLAAADRAAGELARLYGRPVRFVHPLPRRGDLAARVELMRRIGGGAGYDLDSIVTLLPGGKALVADVPAGRSLLAKLPAADWDALRRGYGLEPAGDALSAAMTAAQATPAMEGLGGFLDLVAGELAKAGMEVRRLPILAMPVALLADRSGLSHESFLLTWNNAVVEVRKGRAHAEGFSYLLPSGDQAAREAFAALGARLDLFPPLVRSIVLNGGYRCASNHLRKSTD